jgi:hypothetical protein
MLYSVSGNAKSVSENYNFNYCNIFLTPTDVHEITVKDYIMKEIFKIISDVFLSNI